MPLSFSDHLRRRHARFHKSLKKQVPLKEVFRQAPSPGIPARPDGPRRRQHGNVSILKEDQIVLCVLQLLNLTHRRLWLSAASNHYLSSLWELLQPSRNELIHIDTFEELLRSVKNSDWPEIWGKTGSKRSKMPRLTHCTINNWDAGMSLFAVF